VAVTVTSSHILPLLLPQREDSSHSSPAPAWGHSHGREFAMIISSVGPSHRLQLFRNCSSMGLFHGRSPSGTDCSSMGHPRVHKSCQQTCSSVASSLHRSTGPGINLLQCRLSTGSQPPLGIHLLWHEVLHRLQVDMCFTMDLHRLQWDNLPHHGLHHRLQGKLCSCACITSFCCFFTDLGVCRVVYHIFSLLFSTAVAVHRIFSSPC